MLSKLAVNLLVPCLLFTEIVKNLSFDSISEFLLIFLACSLHVLMGCGVGYLFGMLLRASSSIKRLMMSAIAFQDTTAIPLVYAYVLGNSKVEGIESDFASKATAYVLVYSVFVILYKWTVAYKLLEKDSKESKIEDGNMYAPMLDSEK